MAALRWIAVLSAGAAAYAALYCFFEIVNPLLTITPHCISVPITPIIDAFFCTYSCVYWGAKVAPEKRIEAAVALAVILIIAGVTFDYFGIAYFAMTQENAYVPMCTVVYNRHILEGSDFQAITLVAFLIIRITGCFAAILHVSREKSRRGVGTPANRYRYGMLCREISVFCKILFAYGCIELCVLYFMFVLPAMTFLEALNPLRVLVAVLFGLDIIPQFFHICGIIAIGFVGALAFSFFASSVKTTRSIRENDA